VRIQLGERGLRGGHLGFELCAGHIPVFATCCSRSATKACLSRALGFDARHLGAGRSPSGVPSSTSRSTLLERMAGSKRELFRFAALGFEMVEQRGKFGDLLAEGGDLQFVSPDGALELIQLLLDLA